MTTANALTLKARQINTKARARVAEMPTELLVQCFEQTNGNTDASIPKVREWLMDEMEARNPVAFMEWLESTADSPRSFLLK